MNQCLRFTLLGMHAQWPHYMCQNHRYNTQEAWRSCSTEASRFTVPGTDRIDYSCKCYEHRVKRLCCAWQPTLLINYLEFHVTLIFYSSSQQSISDAATNTNASFNTSVVLESSSRPSTGIYTLQIPGQDSTNQVTVPFIFVDIQYNADPTTVRMYYHLLYEDVPQAVRKTVTYFLTPK